MHRAAQRSTPADEVPDTERPVPGVWRCDELDSDPSHHEALIEATGEPPLSTDAEVYGGGKLLAAAVDGPRMWRFTNAGMVRISIEVQGIIDQAESAEFPQAVVA